MNTHIITYFLSGCIFSSYCFANPFPYDVNNYSFWSESENGNGERCVAFVTKTDMSGDSFKVYYQKYNNNVLVEDNVILNSWKSKTDFGKGNFEIALDDYGYSHFVCSNDSGSCLYLTNSQDSKWKERYVLNKDNDYQFGRRNSISVDGEKLDIITTADYRVSGGWPFSYMIRISGVILDDSLKTSFITSNDIYAEEIYDLKVSNHNDRLVILYALGKWGGVDASRFICSKDYSSSDKYYYIEVISGWYASVLPLTIIDQQNSLFRINISNKYYDIILNSNILETGVNEASVPKVFSLSQNYPNPFNPVTTINYILPKDCKVILNICSITGQRVSQLINSYISAGRHSITWDASGLSSGIYIYSISAGEYYEKNKMILLK